LIVLFESLDESVRVVGRVVVYNVGRVMRIDFVDIFSELAAWLGLNLLAFLEATTLHKGSLGL
jgi:hypothetical protein